MLFPDLCLTIYAYGLCFCVVTITYQEARGNCREIALHLMESSTSFSTLALQLETHGRSIRCGADFRKLRGGKCNLNPSVRNMVESVTFIAFMNQILCFSAEGYVPTSRSEPLLFFRGVELNYTISSIASAQHIANAILH